MKYQLHFHIKFRGDSLDGTHDFEALSDDEARKKAEEFVIRKNRENKEEINMQKISWQDWASYSILSVKEVRHELREVEITRSI